MGIYISIIATLVAAIVSWTGYQQHLLAKEKFKLCLFEKRFAVYKGVQIFLTHIFMKAKVDIDKLFEFRRDTQDAMFLFDDAISTYIKEIDHKALDLHTTVKTYRPLPKGDKRSHLCKHEAQLLRELTGELPKLKDVFAPYLKFKKWK
jgi:hypothetical protein